MNWTSDVWLESGIHIVSDHGPVNKNISGRSFISQAKTHVPFSKAMQPSPQWLGLIGCIYGVICLG